MKELRMEIGLNELLEKLDTECSRWKASKVTWGSGGFVIIGDKTGNLYMRDIVRDFLKGLAK